MHVKNSYGSILLIKIVKSTFELLEKFFVFFKCHLRKIQLNI